MTNQLRHRLYTEAHNYTDPDAYVSALALSSMWDDAEDTDISADRTALLRRIWDDTHCTVRELIERCGLTQSAFARHFNIPLRTVQGWCLGERDCPLYLITMAAELLALYSA